MHLFLEDEEKEKGGTKNKKYGKRCGAFCVLNKKDRREQKQLTTKQIHHYRNGFNFGNLVVLFHYSTHFLLIFGCNSVCCACTYLCLFSRFQAGGWNKNAPMPFRSSPERVENKDTPIELMEESSAA